MKNTTQREMAEKAGITEAFLSYIVNGKRRPSWKVAKNLALVTGTKPELWLDGSPEVIKRTIK